ncbi:putative magnesium transporter NIPA [Rosa chinensis]|uniref:Putative magnesium transporter NIPA n=1 Tax=Rosa chinensis TaxID=74649 RepID=A0A2P6SPP4_ROSCH|nr:putative magnesium transporter NIPA [Rosa chinensis]
MEESWRVEGIRCFAIRRLREQVAKQYTVMDFSSDFRRASLLSTHTNFIAHTVVSVIQPVSGCGLTILSIFSQIYLKEIINAVDWLCDTLAGIGTIGAKGFCYIYLIFHLPWLAIVVVILFVLLNAWLQIYRRQQKEQELMEYEVIEEIIYGLESGILFGMASVISKMGFVFLERSFPSILVPICLVISICCSSTGFLMQDK